jgi:anti-sigma factor RsiW
MIRPMTNESTLTLHAYLDGELDPINAIAVEKRITTDIALAAEFERVESLQRLMREHLPREIPPAGLRMRIETAVGARAAVGRFSHRQYSWRALAASIAVAAFIASGSTSMLLAPSQSGSVREGVIDAHLRSLMAPQPIDVASSDQHTVKPWFNGRIPESPRVVNLAKEDFPLLGGRIDVVREMPVPTLVYAHRKHLISLTAVPDPGHDNLAPLLSVSNGYNTYRWTESGVEYWAVSDMAPAHLHKFAVLFRSAQPDQ